MALALEHRKVLVLNRQWTAVNVCPMDRALRLLYSFYDPIRDAAGKIIAPSQPKAKVIDPTQNYMEWTWEDWSAMKPRDGEDTVNNFRLPEIIKLTRYDKLPHQRVHFNRRTIYKRDNHTCQYCGCQPGDSELTIDHVLPKAQGGLTTWENCVLACVQCNSQKADRIPEQAFKNRKNWKGPSPMVLRTKPRKPRFTFFKGDRFTAPESWTQWISDAYWETELENDMHK
jgi:5-methylcytosine-specific restriction endonuclease McrA